jgi:hypothetical protein
VALLEIEMEIVKEMLQEKISHKKHLMDANYLAIVLGYNYIRVD